METATASADKGFGLTVLFSVIAVMAAAGLFAAGLAGAQFTAAVAFAVAVVAGCLAVSASHLL
ncbi:MAG: hypothetical protein ABEK02_03700 [Haloquadratum sp.]